MPVARPGNDDGAPKLAMTDVPASAPQRRAAFVFVFITVLLDMLALGIIIPVLPKLVVDFPGGDAARAAPTISACSAPPGR